MCARYEATGLPLELLHCLDVGVFIVVVADVGVLLDWFVLKTSHKDNAATRLIAHDGLSKKLFIVHHFIIYILSLNINFFQKMKRNRSSSSDRNNDIPHATANKSLLSSELA